MNPSSKALFKAVLKLCTTKHLFKTDLQIESLACLTLSTLTYLKYNKIFEVLGIFARKDSNKDIYCHEVHQMNFRVILGVGNSSFCQESRRSKLELFATQSLTFLPCNHIDYVINIPVYFHH